MKTKPIPIYYATIALVAVCTPGAALAVSYSFDGTLSNHFNPTNTSAGAFFTQSGGVMNFHTNNVALSDGSADICHTTFAPRYDQSWNASVVAMVPTAYDSLFVANSEFGVSLRVNSMGGYTFGNDFLVSDEGASMSRSVLGYNLTPGDVETDGFAATSSPSVTLWLHYNASTTTLSASADGLGTYFTQDISSWGMGATEAFSVCLSGFSENRAVSSGSPFTLDDFTGTIIPESSTMALLGMAGFALILRRRK